MRGRTAPVAKRGVGDAAPYEVLSVNGVVGVGLPDDPPGLAPTPCKKPVIAKPVRTAPVAIRIPRLLGSLA